MNSASDTERNFSFDILKSFAIFLVITYHFQCWNLNFLTGSKINYFHYFLCCCLGVHVPIFFLVNGALLMNKPFDVIRHTHKTVHLFIITIIHCIITLFLMSVINNNLMSFDDFIFQLKTWENGWIQHLWFLQQLFVIYLLFFLIKPAFEYQAKAVRNFLILYGILVMGNGTMTIIANIISIRNSNTLFSNNVYNFFQNFHPFPSSRSGFLFYFLLGGFLASFNKQLFSNKRIYIASFAILILSTGIIFLYGLYFSFAQQKIFNNVGNNYFSPFTLINVICMYILSNLLSDIFSKNNIITKFILLVSKNTLGIYLVHFPVGKFLNPFISHLFSGNFLLTYTYSFLLLLISLIITLCIKKTPIIRKLYSL